MTALKQRQIHSAFYQFITDEVLPLISIDAVNFWNDLEQLIEDLAPLNRDVGAITLRSMPNKAYCGKQNSTVAFDIDNGSARLAGPRLVSPSTDTRWGSLFHALDSNNALQGDDEEHRKVVFNHSKDFLDKTFPLEHGSHHEVKSYVVYYHHLLAFLSDGSLSGLKTPSQFVALSGHKEQPTSIVLKDNGLHVELRINAKGQLGSKDTAGIDDIVVESASTTIMDFDESMAATSTNEKIASYRHWLELVCGTSGANIETGSRMRNNGRCFTTSDGDDYHLKGQSLLMVRNASLRDSDGHYAPEGIIDAVVTALIASIDLTNKVSRKHGNTGSIYIVKPKMHGAEEMALTCQLFNRVEDMLGLQRFTLKLSVMDEKQTVTVINRMAIMGDEMNHGYNGSLSQDCRQQANA